MPTVLVSLRLDNSPRSSSTPTESTTRPTTPRSSSTSLESIPIKELNSLLNSSTTSLVLLSMSNECVSLSSCSCDIADELR